jgi:O-antigen ligase
MQTQKIVSSFNPLLMGRCLSILLLISLLFSPPLTSLFELSLFGMFIYFDELRKRMLLATKQPMVIATLLFYLMILLSSANTLVSWSEGISAFWGWRKTLLLPIAVALFDDKFWKHQVVFIFIIVTTACAVLSFFSSFFDFALYKYPVGIIIRNHATQGIMFSVAVFSAGMLLLLQAKNFIQSQKWALSLSMVILATNIVYITPGRSGYLAFIVLGATLALAYMYANKKFIIPALIMMIITILLLSSPTVRQRVMQGADESLAYNSKAEATSMGIRRVLWSNTIDLIRERPLFGYGAGGFQNAYESKIVNEPAWKHDITHDPHNQFLKIATEQGLFGLLFFIGLILSSFWQKPCFIYYSLGLGVLAVWCGNSLFSSHFSTFSEGRFLFLWCGVMLAKETT